MNRIPFFLFLTTCLVIIIFKIGIYFTDGASLITSNSLITLQLCGSGSSKYDESETTKNKNSSNNVVPPYIKPKPVSTPNIKSSYKHKVQYLRYMHPRPPFSIDTRDLLWIKVRRKYVFPDTYKTLEKISSKSLKKRLLIQFRREKAVDSGGVSREFFFLISRKMFNPKFGYFHYVSRKNQNLVISSVSANASVNHLNIFRVIGMISALAVFNGNELVAQFSRYFYKLLLGKEITLNDIQVEDPETYSALNTVLKSDPKELGFTFTASEIINGRPVSYDLVPGGSRKKVTKSNKDSYVKKYIKVRYIKRVQKQIDSFLRGFHTLIPKDIISLFTEEELKLLLCGTSKIDVKDWKRYTEYIGYASYSSTIKYFWQVVDEMSSKTKSQLLQFLIGTTRIPISGFKYLEGSNGVQKFTIEKAGTVRHYPVAHTCFNKLDLPPYTSKIMLKRKLLTAMKMAAGKGFTRV